MKKYKIGQLYEIEAHPLSSNLFGKAVIKILHIYPEGHVRYIQQPKYSRIEYSMSIDVYVVLSNSGQMGKRLFIKPGLYKITEL